MQFKGFKKEVISDCKVCISDSALSLPFRSLG